MNKKILILILLGAIVLPTITCAALDFTQPKGGFTNVQSVVTYLTEPVWVIFTGFAVVAFVFAGIMFLTAQGDPNKLTLAKNAFLWGIVGIVVAILGYSIMTIIKTALAE